MNFRNQPSPERRGVLLRLLLASMLILALAQGLNGILTWSALRSTTLQMLVSAINVVGHDRVFHIENAMRLGKPITQMHGLAEMLDGLQRDLPFVTAIAVSLPDGQLVDVRARATLPEALGETVTQSLQEATRGQGAADALSGAAAASSSATRITRVGDDHFLVMAVRGRGGLLEGGLVFVLPEGALDAAMADAERGNLTVLAGSLVVGALILLVATLVLLRLREEAYRRWLYFAPILALLIAQGLYSWHNISTFREGYLDGARANAQRATDRLGEEFDRLFSRGVRIDALTGLDSPFQRILDDIPELASVALIDSAGEMLFSHPPELASGRGDSALYRVETPLHATAPSGQRAPVGALRATLSAEQLANGVRQRLLDAGTVVVTSAIFVVELLIMLAALMLVDKRGSRSRSSAADDAAAIPAVKQGAGSDSAGKGEGRGGARPLLARPAAFGLLFAWALPLSFVPLHMERLYLPIAGIPNDLALAAPISAEMLFALFATLFAGRLADRHGWQWPFLGGTLICAVGALASAWAPDAGSFVAARALVGLGYGLAWMGIQAHVFAASSTSNQTHAIASLVAGIFAGHICGSATGGMLAEQFGHSSVFLVAALAGLVPLIFALVFMREDFAHPQATVGRDASDGSGERSTVTDLLTNRNFAALLALCVIPVSVVQIGMLYFALPVHLGAQGFAPSDVGRVLMVYGISVIYLGPLLGRWMGRFTLRKPFIVLAGLVAGVGMVGLYFDAGIVAMVIVVLLLGISNSFGGPAQVSFSLQLPVVQQVGKSRAMSIQRTADKLGQTLGPLVVGTLFTVFGSQNGLAVTGLLYLLCTAVFVIVASERAARTPETIRAASS